MAVAGALALTGVNSACSNNTLEPENIVCYAAPVENTGATSVEGAYLNILRRYIGVTGEALDDGRYKGLQQAVSDTNAKLWEKAKERNWTVYGPDILDLCVQFVDKENPNKGGTIFKGPAVQAYNSYEHWPAGYKNGLLGGEVNNRIIKHSYLSTSPATFMVPRSQANSPTTD